MKLYAYENFIYFVFNHCYYMQTPKVVTEQSGSFYDPYDRPSMYS